MQGELGPTVSEQELPPFISLPVLSLQSLSCLVQLPECAAATPMWQTESQPCLSPGAALSHPSPV